MPACRGAMRKCGDAPATAKQRHPFARFPQLLLNSPPATHMSFLVVQVRDATAISHLRKNGTKGFGMAIADPAPPDEAPKTGSSSMGKAVATGGIWLGLAQGVRVALTFISAIVLARLLSPADFAVIAMVAPVLALVAMFQDLGLSTATIQARTLSHQQSNAMFWLSLGASIGLCAAIVASAP